MRPHIARLFHEAKTAGLTTSLDTNDDPENLWTDDLREVLNFVDVLLPNEREACRIARTGHVEQAAKILSDRVSIVVIKLGKEGAMARHGEETFRAMPLAVEMVDPIGAGDSFDAGFVHQFIRGRGLEQCLQFANVTGALSTTRAGGTGAFRDATYRDRFLWEHWTEAR